jgi:hypothetical protein
VAGLQGLRQLHHQHEQGPKHHALCAGDRKGVTRGYIDWLNSAKITMQPYPADHRLDRQCST